MELSIHGVTNLIIETQQTRENSHGETYSHMSVYVLDEEGNRTELSLFSRSGDIRIHRTQDARKKEQQIRREAK